MTKSTTSPTRWKKTSLWKKLFSKVKESHRNTNRPKKPSLFGKKQAKCFCCCFYTQLVTLVFYKKDKIWRARSIHFLCQFISFFFFRKRFLLKFSEEYARKNICFVFVFALLSQRQKNSLFF